MKKYIIVMVSLLFSLRYLLPLKYLPADAVLKVFLQQAVQ